ncbi:MAG: DUF6537 domain-containing protein [Paracoccaceae bacterium]
MAQRTGATIYYLEMLPAGLGRRVKASPRRMARLDRLFNKSRRYQSDGLRGFLMLCFLAGLRGYRCRTLRHAAEVAHLENRLAAARDHLPDRYELAVEVIRCRRLIKGYSDTHACRPNLTACWKVSHLFRAGRTPRNGRVACRALL